MPAKPGKAPRTPAAPAPAAIVPPPREVAYGEAPTADLHASLTEDFRRWALQAATPQSVALDLGCGEGRASFFLAPHVKRVIGLDRDAKAIEAAKQRARTIGAAHAEFHVWDVEKQGAARLAPGGADLVVANLFLSKAVVQAAHDALRPGGAFVFTGFGPRQWQEAHGSPFACSEAEVRGWLAEVHLAAEAVLIEDTRIRFRDIAEPRSYLGEETVQKWLRDGRWDALVASFQKAKVLTESRLTGMAKR